MFVNYILIFVTLMLFAGFALDAGVMEMRYLNVQNAAQAAAAAASLVRNENLSSTWSAVGLNAAAANGFQNGVNGITVTMQNPPAIGSYAGNSAAFTAIVSQTLNTSFLGLAGFSHVTVSSAATSVAASNVSLNSAYNIYAIVSDGSSVPNGGFDTANYAYSSVALGHQANGASSGARLSWHGQIFYTGVPNSKNGVANATVTLPAGNYSQLLILAAAAYGPFPSVNFVVNYSGGATTSAYLGISDWCNASNYPGETIAIQSNYRLSGAGAPSYGCATKIFGYTINLDNTRTLNSVVLPNNRDVVVLAMDVVP